MFDQSEFIDNCVEAVADALASIEGKLPEFRRERAERDLQSGVYEGYMVEARELIERIGTRGWLLIGPPLSKRLSDAGIKPGDRMGDAND